MAKYILEVRTNCSDPEKEAEYNDWYNNIHLPDVLETPEVLLTERPADTDTATHRLPEPAGLDSIPIPVDDDFWQLNKVSTTPDEN